MSLTPQYVADRALALIEAIAWLVHSDDKYELESRRRPEWEPWVCRHAKRIIAARRSVFHWPGRPWSPAVYALLSYTGEVIDPLTKLAEKERLQEELAGFPADWLASEIEAEMTWYAGSAAATVTRPASPEPIELQAICRCCPARN